MGIVIIEGIVACFILLIACVVGISNGPVSLVCLYEKKVQERVVELGLISKEQIKRNGLLFQLFGIIPFFFFVLIAVYGINGARGFWKGFGRYVSLFWWKVSLTDCLLTGSGLEKQRHGLFRGRKTSCLTYMERL